MGSDWEEITLHFEQIKGFDPHAASMLAIIAAGKPGPFRLEIADVRLKP